MVVDVGEDTEGAAHSVAQGDVGIRTTFQQLLHCLSKKMEQVQDRVRFSGHVYTVSVSLCVSVKGDYQVIATCYCQGQR